MGYSIVNVADVEPAGPGGAVRFVRRELGVEAFGINWYEIPPNTEGREHDEQESGQEEVNVIIRGSLASTGSTARRCPFARGRSYASIRRRCGCQSAGRRG
jgi:hypothetical protein